MNIRFLGCGLVASFLGRKGGLGPDYNCSPFDGSLVKILALPVGMQEVQAPAYFFKQNYIFFSGTVRILTRLPSNALQLSSGPKNPFLPAKEATRPQPPRNPINKICIKNSCLWCLWITIKAGCEVFDKASWRNPYKTRFINYSFTYYR